MTLFSLSRQILPIVTAVSERKDWLSPLPPSKKGLSCLEIPGDVGQKDCPAGLFSLPQTFPSEVFPAFLEERCLEYYGLHVVAVLSRLLLPLSSTGNITRVWHPAEFVL